MRLGGWRWGQGSSGPGGEAEWGLAGAPSGDSGHCSRLGPETPRLGKGPSPIQPLNREQVLLRQGLTLVRPQMCLFGTLIILSCVDEKCHLPHQEAKVAADLKASPCSPSGWKSRLLPRQLGGASGE